MNEKAPYVVTQRYVNNDLYVCVHDGVVNIVQTRVKGKRRQWHTIKVSIEDFDTLVDLANTDIAKEES